MGIIDAAALKVWMGLDDDNDAATMATAVAGANSAVEDFCNRSFAKVEVGEETARVFQSLTPHLVYVDDFWDLTNLLVKTDDNDDGTAETPWAPIDFQLEPLNGLDGATPVPFYRIRAVANRCYPPWHRRVNVEVTAAWGWKAVPDTVTEATLIKASRLWKRKDSPEGVLGGYADLGPVRVSKYEDPDVCMLLGPYVRTDRAPLIG